MLFSVMASPFRSPTSRRSASASRKVSSARVLALRRFDDADVGQEGGLALPVVDVSVEGQGLFERGQRLRVIARAVVGHADVGLDGGLVALRLVAGGEQKSQGVSVVPESQRVLAEVVVNLPDVGLRHRPLVRALTVRAVERERLLGQEVERARLLAHRRMDDGGVGQRDGDAARVVELSFDRHRPFEMFERRPVFAEHEVGGADVVLRVRDVRLEVWQFPQDRQCQQHLLKRKLHVPQFQINAGPGAPHPGLSPPARPPPDPTRARPTAVAAESPTG